GGVADPGSFGPRLGQLRLAIGEQLLGGAPVRDGLVGAFGRRRCFGLGGTSGLVGPVAGVHGGVPLGGRVLGAGLGLRRALRRRRGLGAGLVAVGVGAADLVERAVAQRLGGGPGVDGFLSLAECLVTGGGGRRRFGAGPRGVLLGGLFRRVGLL